MNKKLIIIFLLVFILTGCNLKKVDDMSIEDALAVGITSNENLYNINNIGYRYYLPRGFTVVEDRDNIQILKSDEVEYFLNVDLVSYYNKSDISSDKNTSSLYKFLPISLDNKKGFLEISQNNDYFLVKMVYNYAIIEAQVKDKDLNNSIINMAYIVSSVKYNDYVINNKFGEDVLELKETTYKIFGPNRDKQSEVKTYAYYLEQYNEYTGEIPNKFQDPDFIGN